MGLKRLGRRIVWTIRIKKLCLMTPDPETLIEDLRLTAVRQVTAEFDKHRMAAAKGDDTQAHVDLAMTKSALILKAVGVRSAIYPQPPEGPAS